MIYERVRKSLNAHKSFACTVPCIAIENISVFIALTLSNAIFNKTQTNILINSGFKTGSPLHEGQTQLWGTDRQIKVWSVPSNWPNISILCTTWQEICTSWKRSLDKSWWPVDTCTSIIYRSLRKLNVMLLWGVASVPERTARMFQKDQRPCHVLIAAEWLSGLFMACLCKAVL